MKASFLTASHFEYISVLQCMVLIQGRLATLFRNLFLNLCFAFGCSVLQLLTKKGNMPPTGTVHDLWYHVSTCMHYSNQREKPGGIFENVFMPCCPPKEVQSLNALSTGLSCSFPLAASMPQ